MNRIDQELAFLFSRLTWPSGMVRERACVAIADLLLNSRWTEIVQRHLIRWMKAQTLESISAIGLLVLLRAKIQDSAFVISSTEQLLSALHKPSVLSWILMNELLPANVPPPNWTTLNSGSAPKDFEPEPFFTKYSRSFLPPIYSNLAEEIEASKSIPFVRQWAFEWRRILDSIDKKVSTGPIDFVGRKDSEHYVVIDFELSEVYRSAYLHALAWAMMIGALSENYARSLTIMTCPIDIGLWRLRPTSKPVWWPKADEPEGKIDTVPAQIWRQVEALWKKWRDQGDDWIIAEASGRVHEGTTAYDLEIFGLFQVCQGATAPSLEELAAWYRWENDIQYGPCSLRFEGIIKPISSDTLAQSFGDWGVVPAACRVSPYTTPRWQFWRIYRDIWLPAPFLSSNQLTFQCSDDALIIRDGEEIIGRWTDWTDGLREKMTANLPPSTGHYLLVRRQKIEEFAAETNSVLCWICRLTGYHREYNYQPYKHFLDHHQYGATNIVIP